MDRDENKKLEDLVTELVPSVEEPIQEGLPEPATPEQIEEAEGLLKQAQLAKIRGQGSVAERILKEAAEKAPGSAAVQAALGDQLWERSQFSRARAAYKTAHLLEPKNVLYETKWAESLVGSSRDPSSLQLGLAESYASAKTATVLSVFVPGLGQLVTGKRTQGIVMLCIWIAGWLYLIPNMLSRLPSAVGPDGARINEFSPLTMLTIGALALTWIWSATSASSFAKGQARMVGQKKIERPTPPGEGNFEL